MQSSEVKRDLGRFFIIVQVIDFGSEKEKVICDR